jgi:hypothetical protein
MRVDIDSGATKQHTDIHNICKTLPELHLHTTCLPELCPSAC